MIVLAVAVTGFQGILTLGASFFVETQFIQEIAKRNQSLTSALAGQVDSFIQNPLYDLKILKSRASGSGAEAWQTLVQEGMDFNPFFTLVQILDSQSKVKASAPRREFLMDMDQSGLLGSLTKDPRHPDYWLSDSILASQTVSATILAAVPFPEGTVLAHVRFDSLNHLVSQAFPRDQGLVAVVDKTGRIMAHNHPEKPYESLSVFNLNPIKQGLKGTVNSQRETFEGVRGLLSVSPVESSGWAVFVFQSEAQAFGILGLLRGFYSILVLLGTLGLGITMVFFIRYLLKPVKRLESQVLLVSRGNYQVQIQSSYAELEALTQGFLQMVDKVRLREAEILSVNQNLEKRIAQRTQALERANKELETFNFTVSHDLRAPLRALDGYSLALLEEFQEALGPQGRTYLDRIRKNTIKMSTLIDDLLTLSRISRLEVRRSSLDLGDMADQIIADLREAEPQRRVEFRRSGNLFCNCDSALAKIALVNLLSNAWKYTGKTEDPRIELGLLTPGALPVFFIRDNGVGFDNQYAHKLFLPFQRLHSESEFPGSGIGLATVSRIFDLHGGWIRGSGTPGLGAEFTFCWGEPRR